MLYKKEPNGTLTKVASEKADDNGRATFNVPDLKLGEYVVKTVVEGKWADFRVKDKHGQPTHHDTVESDESNVRKTLPAK
ncbi:prealbumin-like fold domain-containing protein, partial [Streptococcus pneumoniae]|uniref:prealbumin-like fold domain-containing protein n=1 Tax=Streptococcus pneumoniae TaxID=1313 RepID=UPI0013D914A2